MDLENISKIKEQMKTETNFVEKLKLNKTIKEIIKVKNKK
jgi:hypothetical protein